MEIEEIKRISILSTDMFNSVVMHDLIRQNMEKNPTISGEQLYAILCVCQVRD